MDYKEKYEQALEKARELMDKGYDVLMPEIFPELQESEDERIRKEIIDFLRLPHPQFVGKRDHEKWIAWLEKQDFHYSFEIKAGHWYKCVCDYMLNGSHLMFKNDRLYYCRRDWRLEGEIDERNVKNIGVNGYKSFFRPATNQEIKDWLEKQGEKKPTLPKWKYKKDHIPLLKDSLILNKYGCVGKSPSGAIVSDVWVLDYDELAKLPKEELEEQGEKKLKESYNIISYINR